MAAGPAQAKMNPGVARGQALLATVTRGLDGRNPVQMRTLLAQFGHFVLTQGALSHGLRPGTSELSRLTVI
jgi:hypothetical protein